MPKYIRARSTLKALGCSTALALLCGLGCKGKEQRLIEPPAMKPDTQVRQADVLTATKSNPQPQETQTQSPDAKRGYIVDKKTGIFWTYQAEPPRTWDDADFICNNLSIGGHAWTLPNPASIVLMKASKYKPNEFDSQLFLWTGAKIDGYALEYNTISGTVEAKLATNLNRFFCTFDPHPDLPRHRSK